MTVIHDKIVHNCLIVPERERRSRSRPQCEIFFPCVAKHSAKIANSRSFRECTPRIDP